MERDITMTNNYDWKDDVFLRTHLADTTSAPIAVKSPKFDKQITFVVKPNRGMVYRKTCPEWAKDIVINQLDTDANVNRYFIEEK